MKIFRRGSFCVLLMTIPFLVGAQSASVPDSIRSFKIKNLERRYEHVFQFSRRLLVDFSFTNTGSKDIWKNFVNNAPIPDFSGRNEIVFPEEDLSLHFDDWGFNWVSTANHNFKRGISENGDLFYKTRYATGIDWRLLGEGSLFKRKRDLSLLRMKLTLDSLERKDRLNGQEAHEKLHFIETLFDINHLEILKKYSLLLEKQVPVYDSMYVLGLINELRKLALEQKFKEVKEDISFYEQFISQSPFDRSLIQKYEEIPFALDDLPDWNSLQKKSLYSDKEQQYLLNKQIIEDSKNPDTRVGLRAQARYNYYDTRDNKGRTYASVGASLDVPIRFGRRYERTKSYKLETGQFHLQQEKNRLEAQLYDYYRKFYSLKKEWIKKQDEVQYILAGLDNELEAAGLTEDRYSPAKYIDFTEQFFQKQLELLDIKEQLLKTYILFYSLIRLSAGTSPPEEQTAPATSTYLWKSAFESEKNEEIIKTLSKFHIQTLFISPGENQAKLENLLRLGGKNGIRIFRLIGENSYAAKEDGIKSLIQKMKGAKAQGFVGIHLDIEPQTFTDYKTHKGQYTLRMNTLYRDAARWCVKNDLNLSVSIPMNLPEETAKVIRINDIEPYIMAYGQTDQKKLLARTEALRVSLGNHFVWVLRLSDFAGKTDLKNAESELKNEGITKWAYYDFSSLKNIL